MEYARSDDKSTCEGVKGLVGQIYKACKKQNVFTDYGYSLSYSLASTLENIWNYHVINQ